jgi:hypothetical protein
MIAPQLWPGTHGEKGFLREREDKHWVTRHPPPAPASALPGRQGGERVTKCSPSGDAELGEDLVDMATDRPVRYGEATCGGRSGPTTRYLLTGSRATRSCLPPEVHRFTDVVEISLAADAIIRLVVRSWPSRTTNGPSPAVYGPGGPRRLPKNHPDQYGTG